MERCLFDTSALSDAIVAPTKRYEAVARRAKQYLRARQRFTFSEISYFEIARGLRKKGSEQQLRVFEIACASSELLPVNFAVLDRAATLWADGARQGILVEDNDVIIAATAILEGLPIVTSNLRHFEWIPEIRVENWREG